MYFAQGMRHFDGGINVNLIVIHPQNPRDPATWSRAPYNLINALEKQGIGVHSVTSGPTKSVEKYIYRVAQKLRGSDYTFSRTFRYYSGKKLADAMNNLQANVVLHCATTSALPKNNSVGRHYLYCDSTWNRLIKLTPNHHLPEHLITKVDADERFAYSKVDHIFCFSSAVRNDLKDHYGISEEKLTVVGTGLGNVEPFYGEKDYSSGKILYVAKRSFEQKGGDLLVKAFKIAVSKNPKLSLIMDGGGVPEAAVTGIPNLSLTGLSPRAQLQELFNSACLYAMPALFEPWGNVYLEALACRTPILGLNRNSLPDITNGGKYGFLVDNPTPEAIADAILNAFSDASRLRKMGIEGQKYCLENYTWEVVAKRILDKIENDGHTH